MKKIEAGDPVVVVRDLVRREGPYAKAGEVGVVHETFQPMGRPKDHWCAKVIMDATGTMKTFRLTSLEHA